MNRAEQVIGALLLAGSHAWSQSTPLSPPDLQRYLTWGPFRVRPGLQLSNIGYDDNILYRYELDPRPAVGDYTATLTPKVEGVVLFGSRAFFTFDGHFDYTYYLHNSSVSYANVFSDGRLTV